MLIDWQALKRHRQEAPLLGLDIVVLGLIALDLLCLLADKVLMDTGVGLLVAERYPAFHDHYRLGWHKSLQLYDTLFTGFLFIELGLRWALAIVQRRYHRWFFYPFIHWYDVLGLVPGLQALRLLRLVSLLYRLNRLGILALGQGVIRVAQKYYAIVLEELSDRIVVNVLDGVQRELRANNPVSSELRATVLLPQRDVISHWLAGRIGALAGLTYVRHEHELERYLLSVTRDAIAHNPEWRALRRRLPVVGNLIETELNDVIGGLVNSIVARLLTDLSRPDNAAVQDVAEAVFDTFTHSDVELDRAIEQILIDAIDLIKAQVAIQQWKVEERDENRKN